MKEQGAGDGRRAVDHDNSMSRRIWKGRTGFIRAEKGRPIPIRI